MRNLLLTALGALAFTLVFYVSVPGAKAQSTYFTGLLGEARGQAWTSGNQTNVTSAIGEPLGSARSQYGAPPPVGVAITPLPQPQPIQRIEPIQGIQPIQPIQGFGR